MKPDDKWDLNNSEWGWSAGRKCCCKWKSESPGGCWCNTDKAKLRDRKDLMLWGVHYISKSYYNFHCAKCESWHFYVQSNKNAIRPDLKQHAGCVCFHQATSSHSLSLLIHSLHRLFFFFSIANFLKKYWCLSWTSGLCSTEQVFSPVESFPSLTTAPFSAHIFMLHLHKDHRGG